MFYRYLWKYIFYLFLNNLIAAKKYSTTMLRKHFELLKLHNFF